jgi:hypothetical protein
VQERGHERLEDHVLAGIAPDERRDVGMPAVVSGPRVVGQRLCPVPASSASVFVRSMRISFLVVVVIGSLLGWTAVAGLRR